MKTAHNEIAAFVDLETARFLLRLLWEQENPKPDLNQNFIPKAYRIGVSEEFQDKVGKINHPHTETF